MKNSIIGRLLVSAIVVIATVVGAAGAAHAEDLVVFVGDYPGMGSPADVVCRMGITAVQCFPIEPTYPAPGEKPSTCAGPRVTLTLARSGPATASWRCTGPLGGPNAVRWQLGHSEQIGVFRCTVTGTAAAPAVFCARDDGSGNGFEVSRTSYQLRDGA
ncbi:hypothetical protein [Nocardia altamirensis]|uniref:hypothetical protein n=1 Tax=Nocardia altamirensis TaxID=472158 RepID=UPI0008408994|nr:hypothetical protein [Nocardia altamirensis]